LVLFRAIVSHKRDTEIKKMKAFMRLKENEIKHTVMQVLQRSEDQSTELKRIKQAHLSTVQAFVNSKTELESKLVRMATLISQKVI
jgi:hypothetical protein